MEVQTTVEYDGDMRFTGSKFVWKLGPWGSYADADAVSSPKFKDEHENEWMMEITSFQYGARREFRITLQILEFGGGLEAFTAAIGIAGPTLSIVSSISAFALVNFSLEVKEKRFPLSMIKTSDDTNCFIYLQICKSNDGGLFEPLRRERLGLAWKDLLHDAKFSDATIFSSSEKSFQCHKAVLSARSPVLSAMFSNECSESKENEVDLSVFPEAVVQGFLEFIYTDRTEILLEHSEEWLRIADMYKLDGLKTDAGAAIGKTLTAENVLEIFRLVHVYSVEDLKPKLNDFMKRNSSAIASNKSGIKKLGEISLDLVTELFFAING